MTRKAGRAFAAPALVVAVLLALCSPAAAGPYDGLLAPASRCGNFAPSTAAGAQVFSMYCYIAYARQQSGLAPLRPSTQLNVSTSRKASDVLACQQFSHTACGRDFTYHMRSVGYATGCWAAGENLALGSGSYGSARSIMLGWLNSDGHRRNMLSTTWRDMGVGMVKGSYQGYGGVQVWATHFGLRC
jgi:uncharacterized protein YkwD